MNFALTDEQRMLQDALRRRLADTDAGSAGAALTELGVHAALFSESAGGLGGSGADLAVVFEELGRAGVVDPVIESSLLCGTLLSELAAASQPQLLARVVAGEAQLAFAHSEPDSRYDLNRVTTRATTAAEQVELTGRKSVVVNAEAAEQLLVSARSEGRDDATEGIALYLLPASTPGVTLHGYDMANGGRAADVILEKVHLPTSSCLSSNAFAAIEHATAAATVAQCAETLGAMETATAMTNDYLCTRQQFGRPLASFQVLAHRLVDMYVELEQARSAVIMAAGHLGADKTIRDLNISAAKNLLGRVGKLIAEESIQLHGGIGMTAEYQLGHFAKRIVMADHRFGDVDYHLERFIASSRYCKPNGESTGELTGESA